jgi:alanine-synthesizing transaminase
VFSTRVPHDRRPNRLALALERANAAGRNSQRHAPGHTGEPLLDLTISNPTLAGIHYPADLLAGLSDPASLIYHPTPFGLLDARAAIAAAYDRRGIRMEAERIVLTASTSEAYSILFKLLSDPGCSNVLTPVPSYPLFDHLTRLDGVEQRRYSLEFHGTWCIPPAELDCGWSSDTRAVLVVSPNNPTGSIVRDEEADALVSRCAERQAALIVDEVFCDYPLDRQWQEPPAFLAPACLFFRLGGLSKTVALPQLKLGWIAVGGPADLVDEALDRLELICDSYLSVSTPVQVAARSLLDRGVVIRDEVLARIRANHAYLRAEVPASGAASLLPADGGWSAVLRVPATRPEEDLVVDLLERDRVVVHPGYFFDFPHEAFLIVSLLPEPDIFRRGVRRILERVDAA